MGCNHCHIAFIAKAASNDALSPKNYDQQTRWMKKEIETIEGAIHREKQTYNYLFSEAETEEQKQELIKKFIYQVFRINIPQSTGS